MCSHHEYPVLPPLLNYVDFIVPNHPFIQTFSHVVIQPFTVSFDAKFIRDYVDHLCNALNLETNNHVSFEARLFSDQVRVIELVTFFNSNTRYYHYRVDHTPIITLIDGNAIQFQQGHGIEQENCKYEHNVEQEPG
jgi:hypothetical protein